MSSGKGLSRPRGETEAEKTLRKRRESEQKGAQMVDSRSARHQSRSSIATDDGLGDAAASGKRKADASSTPHDSPDKLPKRGSKKTKRWDASLQSSSSEDDEESVTGAVETGKSKLARRTGLQIVQVSHLKSTFSKIPHMLVL